MKDVSSGNLAAAAQQLGERARSNGPLTRSLSSMLADSRRALPPDEVGGSGAPEGELEGESAFVPLSQDFAPLFQARLLSSPTRRVGSEDSSSRELLTDLFPTGFTSNTLSPLNTVVAAATEEADEFKPASARTLGETEPELKGRQVWACLVPKAVPAAAVASSKYASDVGRETERHRTAENARENKHLHESPLTPSWGLSHQSYGLSELHQPSCEGPDTDRGRTRDRDATTEFTDMGSSNAKATTATRRTDLGAPPAAATLVTTRDKTGFVSDGGDHGAVAKAGTAGVAGRERESDLKHALDRLVPRLMKSQERVSEAVRVVRPFTDNRRCLLR